MNAEDFREMPLGTKLIHLYTHEKDLPAGWRFKFVLDLVFFAGMIETARNVHVRVHDSEIAAMRGRGLPLMADQLHLHDGDKGAALLLLAARIKDSIDQAQGITNGTVNPDVMGIRIRP